MQQAIEREREQLLSQWTRAFARRSCWLTSPPPQLTRILRPDGPDPRMAMRKLHDRLGWCAKGPLHRGGLCSGAIFRTDAFIRIPQQLRSGSRRAGQNVHIEHTVPVNVLITKFADELAHAEPARKLAWLLKHSVTTAMQKGQDKDFLRGVARTTTAFSNQRPFDRYDRLFASPERVWDVWNREEVDPNRITFDAHFEIVLSLLGAAGASNNFIRQLEATI